MARDEVTDRNPGSDITELEDLGKNVELAWRCNAAAVESGRLELTYPSHDLIARFARDPKGFVVRVRTGGAVEGLGVFTSSTKRAGGYLRWLIVPPGAKFEQVAREIIDAGVERFGSAWGRVSNPAVHAALVGMGYRADKDDPEVLYADPVTRRG
jgi:hypothetical protein